jgi:hypothetical protein
MSLQRAHNVGQRFGDCLIVVCVKFVFQPEDGVPLVGDVTLEDVRPTVLEENQGRHNLDLELFRLRSIS